MEQLRTMGGEPNERQPWGSTNMVTRDKATNQSSAASDPRSRAGLGKAKE